MFEHRLTRNFFIIALINTIFLIILFLGFILGATVYRHIVNGGDRLPLALITIVEKLSELPSLLRIAGNELRDELTNNPSPLLISKDNIKHAGFVHNFPSSEDDGYLLLSGLSDKERQSVVQLIRIADGQLIAKWQPDWNYIHSLITKQKFGFKGNVRSYRAIHPLLLNDASIIFNSGNALVRLPLCSSKPDWVLNYPFHHSVELSSDGSSVWVPSVTDAFATDNEILKQKLRDDSLSEVSLDGRVLKNISFSKILSENNKFAHMLGSTGSVTNLDPLHINQITPATSNSPYWQRDDLLISARHTSTIYLYRPSTGKIIWYQQGPWLNQHSAHFSNDNSIAVFGNDVYGDKLDSPYIYKEAHNQIYLYNFESNMTNILHSNINSNNKPKTITEGRVRVFDDLSIFVEETNNARLFKLDSTGSLIWSYVNTYDHDNLGVISWSRYMTKKELKSTINFEKLKCN